MRTETVEIYKFPELSDEAKERARDWWREANGGEIFWQAEIFDSLKSLFKHVPHFTMCDYELGLNCYSYLKVNCTHDEVENLSGPRAMAWLENNVLSALRIPWTGKKRADARKYHYWPDTIPPCPFTGYCADDDYLEALIKSVREGLTLKHAFEDLASVYVRLLETESDDQNSDEYIDEHLEANEYEFTADGARY